MPGSIEDLQFSFLQRFVSRLVWGESADRGGGLHTQVCQPVVEASPRVIKALVGDCQPLQFLGQDLVAVLAQHFPVDIVQGSGVFIDEEGGLLRSPAKADRHGHCRGRLFPSWCVGGCGCIRVSRCRQCGGEGRLLRGFLGVVEEASVAGDGAHACPDGSQEGGRGGRGIHCEWGGSVFSLAGQWMQLCLSLTPLHE